jgi:predicted extracellular nuclease
MISPIKSLWRNKMARFVRHLAVSMVVLSMLLTFMPAQVQPVSAISPNIVISQVNGGGGNSGATYKNDFIELYNLGATQVDVTGWSVQYASSTGTSWQKTILSGTIDPGKYYLVQEGAGAGGTVNLPTPNAIGSSAMSATSGKIALVSNSTNLTGSCPVGLIDFVGYGTAANCSEGAPTANLSNTTAALRKSDGAQDTDNNSADFTVSAPNPRNTPPPDAAPAVASTIPADGAASVPLDSNVTITFTEGVNVSGSWFTLSCSLSGVHEAAVSGGPTTFSLDPDANFIDGDICTLTVLSSQVTDQDNNDPPDNMTINFTASYSTGNACLAPYTSIYNIQGSGLTAAITGSVTTLGVVVGDNEGASPALRGFFLQDLSGDDAPATSDGIFVFNGNNDSVNLGDVVRVSGKAEEYQGQTQISTVTSIINCGAGSVDPVDVTLPFASADAAEQYEGMLVRLPQTLYVTEHYQLGRFGEVLLASGGRLKQPTNVALPGAPALALQAQNDLNQILVDDASQAQNPDPIVFGRNGNPLSASNTLRGGDTATGIVGILTYTWGGNAASPNAYRIRPINALNGYINFEAANPRPAAVPEVGGTTKVVGMNVLNFFNTLADGNAATPGCFPSGTDADCRGATSALEFERQWTKTVAAIVAMDADVVGFNEIENDGYDSDSSIAFLVDQLNAATLPGTYAFIDVDTATGQVNALGTDAIRVGMIYQLAKVTPLGQTAVLNTAAFVNGGDSAPRSRPSLLQAFEVNGTGARFIVNINHLKSKGSACEAPDAFDGQGNCNQVRVNAVTELMNWFAIDPTGTHETDILMLGDYNSYAKEDPITTLENAGFTNLIESFLGEEAYSYVFDGQWGYLDHALGSASLVSQVVGVADYHIDSDEPSVLDYNTDFKSAGQLVSLYAPDQFRISDHDPVLVGLSLRNDPPVADAGGPYTANEGETVALNASGYDPDQTSVTFAWDLDNDLTFETPGQNITFNAVDGPAVFPINLQVTDETGLSTVVSTTLTVTNSVPTVSPLVTSPEPSTEGSSVIVSASFSDQGLNDAPFTCTVNYGDGTGEIDGIVNGNICSGPAHIYPTYGSYTVTVNVTDKDNGIGSNTTTHNVLFNWSGFFQPVDNLPALNAGKAGRAFPLKFSLGRNKGLNIFATGSPVSVQIACDSGAPIGESIQTNTPGSSDLTYSSGSKQYHYVWKTEKAWAGTCRQLTIQLVDGTFHSANFQFK